MSGDDATSRAAVQTFSRSRIKPVIYNTTEGLTIVEDELLNFLAVKIKTLSQDDIVLLATNNFGSESIEASKNVLFDLCPTTQRNIAHKGQQKDASNIKSCLKVLNECGDKIPRFVSHFLDELPPVSYSSLDVSSLLGKIQKTYEEVCLLKNTMHAQAKVAEEFRATAEVFDRRVSALESASAGPAVAPVRQAPGRPEERDAAARSPRRTAPLLSPSDTEAVPTGSPVPTAVQGPTERTPRAGREMAPAVAGSPGWNTVVKKHRPKQVAAAADRARAGRKRNPIGAAPIVGTGTRSTIQTIKTKLVSVFASKFSPELDAETLSIYLKEQLGREVKCQKLGTGQSRFGSFKVSAECNEVSEMYQPQIWPDGALVRRFYEPRREGRPVELNSVASTSGEMRPSGR